MRLLDGLIHFLNEVIEMEVTAMLQVFICSEEHQIGETPGTGERTISRVVMPSSTGHLMTYTALFPFHRSPILSRMAITNPVELPKKWQTADMMERN
jgi:hypothetical protein